LALIHDNASSVQAYSVGEDVDVTWPAKAVDLGVVGILVRDQLATFYHLEEICDIQ